jgi:hypothetical protein
METIFLNENAYPKKNNSAPYSGPNLYKRKYVLQALRGYSTHLNEQKVLINICPEINAC